MPADVRRRGQTDDVLLRRLGLETINHRQTVEAEAIAVPCGRLPGEVGFRPLVAPAGVAGFQFVADRRVGDQECVFAQAAETPSSTRMSGGPSTATNSLLGSGLAVGFWTSSLYKSKFPHCGLGTVITETL